MDTSTNGGIDGSTSSRRSSNLQQASSFHIPYRNSVMTSILRDSLGESAYIHTHTHTHTPWDSNSHPPTHTHTFIIGGNCRTVFVVTLNTELDHLEETLSTCRSTHSLTQSHTHTHTHTHTHRWKLSHRFCGDIKHRARPPRRNTLYV
jgi:hypothetical protein